MAETPSVPAERTRSRSNADVPVTDRGVARALLQGRVEAARSRPEWASALRMGSALAPSEASQEELDVWALRCLEDGILTFTDLVRRVSDERRWAEAQSRIPGSDR